MSDLCLMLLTSEGTLIQCFDSRSDKISPPTSSRVTGSFDLRPLGIITPVCGSSSRWKFWSKPRLRATAGRKKGASHWNEPIYCREGNGVGDHSPNMTLSERACNLLLILPAMWKETMRHLVIFCQRTSQRNHCNQANLIVNEYKFKHECFSMYRHGFG